MYTTRLIIPELLSSDDEQTGKVTVRNSVGTTEYQFQFQNLTGLLLENTIHRQNKNYWYHFFLGYLKTGAIVGIVAGVIGGIVLVGLVAFFVLELKKKKKKGKGTTVTQI